MRALGWRLLIVLVVGIFFVPIFSHAAQIGVLAGYCTSVNGHLAIQLNWTDDYRANSNGLQKGDLFPSDPNTFWGWLLTTPTQRAYTDTAIVAGTTYSYRVKYRPELPSNVVQLTCRPAPTVSLTANPSAIPIGGSTTLTWTSTNTVSCQATGGWSGSRALSGSETLTPDSLPRTFTLTCTNGSRSTSAETTVQVVTSSPPPLVPAGTIAGVCVWNNGSPQIVLTWSQYPPPNQGSATSNSLQKGDSFPDDPSQYWDFLPNNPTQYTYTDSAVQINTQYQYRVKYRPDLASLNTYSIYTSAASCGGPAPTPGPLTISPIRQGVQPNVTAIFNASGGDGTYTWEAQDGTISGSGAQIGVSFTNASTDSIFKTVTVHSAGQSATATVEVFGIQTLQDSIDLLSFFGARHVIINNDDATTTSSDVSLALAHGFADTDPSLVTMQLANTQAGVASAPVQPFQDTLPWNICTGLAACPSGLYQVYALFSAAGKEPVAVVFDSIVYLSSGPGALVQIDGDAPVTDDRSSTLLLQHGFTGIPDDEISMQIANKPELLDAAPSMPYSAFVSGWDLCAGYDPICPNGTKTVYVRFCARGVCQGVVLDTIDLQSPWPDWGVKINNDDLLTTAHAVQLQLNPFFDAPGTTVLVSNEPDMFGAVSQSFAALVPWDLCTGKTLCGTNLYTVYVRYINHTAAWPSADSPQYHDDIIYGVPTPTPLPAGIRINNGARDTSSRFVNLGFMSPYGTGQDVTMRPVNAAQLTSGDRIIIANTLASSSEAPELESGTVRQFVPTLGGWDLCGGAADCPYGTYTVYVQYYEPAVPGAPPGVLGTVGDLISIPYSASIVYAAPTPTPSLTPSPSASSTPGTSPTGPGSPGGGLSGLFGVIQSFIQVLSQSQGVISPIAIATALAVAISAIAALLPLIGPGLIAFAWQSLMGILGLLPKRKKTWGTIYDANTKRPIPFAKVQLLDRNRRVLETHVADKDGRYGFLTAPESLMAQNIQISILPSQTGYTFPSHTPATIDTFVYNNLYYGDLITVNDKTLINFDIPMDPIKPSTAPLLVKSPSIAAGAGIAAIADAGFWLGLIMVPLNFLISPNPFTLGTLFLFLGTASLRIFGVSEHPYGVVIDSATGRAMPFALITLNDLTGKRVAFAVSDERGRYFIVAERGSYELAAFTPATVVPPRQSRVTIQAKKGWITRQITL